MLASLIAILAAILMPASAHATTVTMGDPNLGTYTMGTGCFPCTPGETLAQSFAPDAEVNFAPAAGLITSWQVLGQGVVKLSVLESAPEGGWVAVGTSATSTNLEGQPNTTSLPIGAGDMIGVDLGPINPGKSVVGFSDLTNAEVLRWAPQLTNNEIAREPDSAEADRRLQLNANVVLTPVLSSLSPSSGSTSGGSAVQISGLYLDGASSVSFGSTPASSFSVDSSSQITAIAPATGASTVDVRVTGPGGSSGVGAADRYTFTAPAASTPPVNPTPTQLVPDITPAKPAVTGFSESASRWRRGHTLPHISSTAGAPVGTTFSFSLNEPATTTFTFTQRMAGRRAHGKCVSPSPGNAHSPKCKRTVVVGSFGASGKAGLNTLHFQGRLSSAKPPLRPGNYAVSVTARDAHGLNAVSRSLPFTIVS